MHSYHPRDRNGFTLSEVLVVLGVLVVITALALPAVRGSLGDSRLRSAAKLVRIELAKTRLKAMQTGVAQQFRYRLGNNRFGVSPAVADASEDRASPRTGRDGYLAKGDSRHEDVLRDGPRRESAARGGVDREGGQRGSAHRDAAGQERASREDRIAYESIEQCLPEGVNFDALPGEPPTAPAVGEDGWSEPILFYPDGRTENAHIRLKGERNAVVEVSLRGLTGVATAGKPRHEEAAR